MSLDFLYSLCLFDFYNCFCRLLCMDVNESGRRAGGSVLVSEAKRLLIV